MAALGASLANMLPFSFFGQPDGGLNAGAAAAANNTSSPFPAGMVDNLLLSAGRSSPILQVVLFVYRTLGAQFGLDPSVLLTVVGFLWGLSKLGSQLWQQLSTLVDRHLMCAMYVADGDQVFEHVMKWLSQHPAVVRSHNLTAQTVTTSAWDEAETDEGFNSLLWTDGGEGDGEGRYLNFSNQEARTSPRYVPAPGTTTFWHRGTFFKVTRKKESMLTGGWSGVRDVEELKIACFGRSIEPIKRLLADARQAYYHDTSQKTTIYRPKPKDTRRDWNMWQTVARRPVRPMSTVVLDGKEKHDVLVDVNEYLHPATPRWYASRGIPLRRGYLFHGPPGTGKTSFSFALAGVFGLDIYVISLQDINVTEEDLAVLFTKLPRRCIILLEDIDTAGLRREADEEKDEEEEEDTEEKKKDTAAVGTKLNGETPKENGEVKKDANKDDKTSKKKKKRSKKDSDSDSDTDSSEEDRKKRRKRRAREQKSRGRDRRGGRDAGVTRTILTPESISLSGLLNAIDGVASHEGRVLIMTTNKPESLDEALIRPGRVDLQVAFQNASKDQAGELFHRMYEGSRPRLTRAKDKDAKTVLVEDKKVQSQLDSFLSGEIEVSSEDLAGLAKQFAVLVPTSVFSPAEIQGFLLKRKKSPRKALEDASEWIEATVKQKEAKLKVVTVQ